MLGGRIAQRGLKVAVNGKVFDALPGETILDLCDRTGAVKIPRLCYHPNLPPRASCRLCLVECNGSWLAPACVTTVWDGLKVSTEAKAVKQLVKGNLRMLLESHDERCTGCLANQGCEFREYCVEYGATSLDRIPPNGKDIDTSVTGLRIDTGKCVLCGRCVRACEHIVGVKAIQFTNRGVHMQVEATGGGPLASSGCIACGQCRLYCPVGAITEDPSFVKKDRLQVDVAALASLRDEYEFRGEAVPSKVSSVARGAGYTSVTTGEEEAIEYVRASARELTSSVAGTIYSARCAAFAKLAPKLGLKLSEVVLKKPADAVIVSNCIAGRTESTITPRVFALSLKGANWGAAPQSPFDDVPKVAKSLAVAGGTAAAVLREATGAEVSESQVDGVKVLEAGGLKAAVVDGLAQLPQAQRMSGLAYVEVNVCPGGCIGGGGGPQSGTKDTLARRQAALADL